MASTEWGSIVFIDPETGTRTTVKINATETTTGTIEFTLSVVGDDPLISAGDLLGFFIDFEGENNEPTTTLNLSGDAIALRQGDDNVLWVGTKANNMNGTSSNAEEGATSNDAYDVGVQLTSAGASGSNSDSITFTISGISLDQLDGQRFGIRLQNTLNAEGSLKLEGVFERPDAPECNFSGYSRGSWLYGDRSGDRDPLLLKYDLMETTFEELFLEAENDAVTYGGVQNTTITGALDLNGGGNNQLAAQATAAYLNALYFEQDNDQLTCYRLTTEQIKTLTADALVGNSVNLDGYYWYVDDNAIKGFDAGDSVVLGTSTNNAEDLKNLFDFNNNLSGLLTPLPNPMVTV